MKEKGKKRQGKEKKRKRKRKRKGGNLSALKIYVCSFHQCY